MFESLTSFIPELQQGEYGKWHFDKESDGTPEHPFQLPFVVYNLALHGLEDALYSFMNGHEDLYDRNYSGVLNKAGIQWALDSMQNADVSKMDAKTVLAMLVGMYRAERFCDGTLLSFCESGTLQKCLLRLKQLDERR